MIGGAVENMRTLVNQAKKYARIDYTDEDDLVEVIVGAVIESMADVIPGFKLETITSRQKIILYKSVKSLYDDRDAFERDPAAVKVAAASMLLSEIYEPKAVEENG